MSVKLVHICDHCGEEIKDPITEELSITYPDGSIDLHLSCVALDELIEEIYGTTDKPLPVYPKDEECDCSECQKDDCQTYFMPKGKNTDDEEQSFYDTFSSMLIDGLAKRGLKVVKIP